LEGREPPIRFDDPLLEAQFRLLYQRYLDAPPEQKQQILNDLLAVLRSKELQVRADMADYLAEAEEAREKLRMLGTVPRIQRSYEGSLSLQLTKLYRNGMSLAPFIDLSGGGLSYQGKPKDEEFGGPGVKDSYDARLGFSVGIPLGRGRGFASAGAAEQSAILDVAASIDALTHAASASVLNTALAYWDALAAQQTLAVHSKSLELQMQLKELAELLIQADELPRIELVRVQARQAEVQALMEGARRTAHEARLALARTMGLEVRTTADAPAPSDDFPPVPAKVELACANAAELAAASLERRLDYRAAVRLQESGKVLWRAAAIDLAPRADLNFSTWYGSLAEDSDVLEGLKGVVTGRWAGPSARIGLTYERPYENNTQKGKLEQAAAAFRQRAISARDLERAIKAGVVRELASLREAARQLARIQEAVELHRQAVDNEMEKLRMGTATVIDTILTEQRYVDAQLQLIAARQQVARLLARLRYETGTLITTGDAGAFVSRDDLVALPPLAQ
jgi:outer membrane protein TolC